MKKNGDCKIKGRELWEEGVSQGRLTRWGNGGKGDGERMGRAGMPESELTGFHEADHSLGEPIHAVRLVRLLETGTEEPCKSLIESGFRRTEECLDKLITGGIRLAIDELDEQFSL